MVTYCRGFMIHGRTSTSIWYLGGYYAPINGMPHLGLILGNGTGFVSKAEPQPVHIYIHTYLIVPVP